MAGFVPPSPLSEGAAVSQVGSTPVIVMGISATNTVQTATWTNWLWSGGTNWLWSGGTNLNQVNVYGAIDPVAPEERARRGEEARLAHERRLQAEGRAMALFLDTLTPEQRLSWETNAEILIDAPSGRRYKLSKAGGAQRVRKATGERLLDFCYHLAESGYPRGDALLAKKLELEFNESAFLSLMAGGAHTTFVSPLVSLADKEELVQPDDTGTALQRRVA